MGLITVVYLVLAAVVYLATDLPFFTATLVVLIGLPVVVLVIKSVGTFLNGLTKSTPSEKPEYYLLVHLCAPIMIAAYTVIAQGARTSVIHVLTRLGQSYLIYTVPHWIWAAICIYSKNSKPAVVGGYLGAHLLLVTVVLLVYGFRVLESSQGLIVYYVGVPFAIAIGGLIGRAAKRKIIA